MARWAPTDSTLFWERPVSGDIELSIVMVSYNTADMTIAALRSVFETAEGLDYEVRLFENGSTDNSAEAIRTAFPADRYPNFVMIETKQNVGFVRGNNLCAKDARGRYLLLLNPDTLVLPGAIQALLAFAKRTPKAGIWSGKTLKADGTVDIISAWAFTDLRYVALEALGLRRLFPESYVWSERYPSWNRDSEREVDVVIGAFMLVDGRIWRTLQGFDDRIFMYFEEEEFCHRARTIGAHARFSPEPDIYHYGQGVTNMFSPVRLVRYFSGLILVARTHWTGPASRMCQALCLFYALRQLSQNTLLAAIRGGDRALLRDMWREVWARRKEWIGGYQPRP